MPEEKKFRSPKVGEKIERESKSPVERSSQKKIKKIKKPVKVVSSDSSDSEVVTALDNTGMYYVLLTFFSLVNVSLMLY